jgi:large subunit ribosomal protein L18e
MKTQIEKKLKRKTDQDLVETIIAGKKKSEWNIVAHKISKPSRKQTDLNLDEIEAQAKEGENVVVPGKVLGLGAIKKKIKISALAYSESAKEKLSKGKIEFNFIGEEIKKNPEAKDVRILERAK